MPVYYRVYARALADLGHTARALDILARARATGITDEKLEAMEKELAKM
jgi:hypothetical protein